MSECLAIFRPDGAATYTFCGAAAIIPRKCSYRGISTERPLSRSRFWRLFAIQRGWWRVSSIGWMQCSPPEILTVAQQRGVPSGSSIPQKHWPSGRRRSRARNDRRSLRSGGQESARLGEAPRRLRKQRLKCLRSEKAYPKSHSRQSTAPTLARRVRDENHHGPQKEIVAKINAPRSAAQGQP